MSSGDARIRFLWPGSREESAVSLVSQPSPVVVSGVLAVGLLRFGYHSGQDKDRKVKHKHTQQNHIVNSSIVYNSRMIPLDFDSYACSPFSPFPSRTAVQDVNAGELGPLVNGTLLAIRCSNAIRVRISSVTGCRRANSAFT